jgi:hemerythrin-like domain-containing protein
MRSSITLLQYEHGVIRQVMDCLNELVRRELTTDYERQGVEIYHFLVKYLDSYHHRKEERFLFPFACRVSDKLGDKVESLLKDHRKARALLKSLGTTLRQNGIEDSGLFNINAHDLIEHVNKHMENEEKYVFPQIEESIPIDEDRLLSQKYHEFTLANFGDTFLGKSEEFALKMQNEIMGPGHRKEIV